MTPYGHRQLGDVAPAQIKLTAADEADGAIIVTGQIVDMQGIAFAGKRDVLVETVAETAGKGSITVVAGNGTQKVAIDSSTEKIQRTWLETTADGGFKVSIEADAGKSTLVAARANGCFVASLVLAFAAAG